MKKQLCLALTLLIMALSPVSASLVEPVKDVDSYVLYSYETGYVPEYDASAQIATYTRLSAVPARRNPADEAVIHGGKAFVAAACTSCHLPTMTTDSGEDILPELRGQVFHVYTDLLLHDMGDGFADNFTEGVADGREWRTAPLWGLGLVPVINGNSFYLHDGRTRNLQEAILWHGGAAEKSRRAYMRLLAAERADLLAFLRSL